MKITTHLFAAFLKCPTKGWLRAADEPPTGGTYAEWVQTQTESYRADGTKRLVAETPQDECAPSLCGSRGNEAPSSVESLKSAQWRLAVDVPLLAEESKETRSSRREEAHSSSGAGSQSLVTSAATNQGQQPPSRRAIESRLHAIVRVPSEGRGKPAQFIPIRFIFRNKLGKDDKLLLAFDAFVLSEMLGREVRVGKIIHGDDHATLKVKTSTLAGEVRKRLEKIAALLANPAPPDLVLNRHCAECEFQARCRKIAIEKDDLSLLARMTEKERKGYRSKGIFTVTQLSYTFRPRRRPKRQRDKREKYHHSLKALAIREKKIHIVGSPELKIEGTPVYLDVEGLPDRDFYYLIGLRIGHGEAAVQHSLWADTVADEGKIWRKFLAILETVEKPVLIHYGSYETSFAKQMSERHGSPEAESVAAKAIASALNLVSVMFSRIYFPTLSNGLKEIAGWFGFKWSERNASGTQAICWRTSWEQSKAPTTKERVINYCREDCVALETLTNALPKLLREADSNPSVEFTDASTISGTERGKELRDCFGYVLKSAHADYKYKRIAVQGVNLVPKEHAKKAMNRQKLPHRTLPTRGGRKIKVARKRKCQRHPDQPTSLKAVKRESELALLDLAFVNSGCKKGIVRYVGRRGYCPCCHSVYPPPTFKRLRGHFFGFGFQAWAVYLRVALRLSFRLIAKATRDLLHEEIPIQTFQRFVERVSKEHGKTEEALLQSVLGSPVIHIDETKINILGTQQYVWVMTDSRHVIFRLTPSREANFLHELLAEYKGTIVSDFYGGYDGLPCLQQKCLAHLIRDMNDDLWKHPFDERIEALVAAVRDLLIPIFEDVQRFGLKSFHLRKHTRRVERFYERTITGLEPDQDPIAKYKKRFERYRGSMFTFLQHDGVSWNNNAAERAIRHLAVQRKISGAFTTKGANHYLRLLAIAQTCRFQSKSFLGFVLSRLQDVDLYHESRHRRRNHVSKPAIPLVGESDDE